MEIAFLIIILAAIALIVFAAIYFLAGDGEEPPPPPKPAAPPPKPAETAAQKAATPRPVKPGGFVIPPFVPRTLSTIKIIAEERPDVILSIVRRWLREGQKKTPLKSLLPQNPPPKSLPPKK